MSNFLPFLGTDPAWGQILPFLGTDSGLIYEVGRRPVIRAGARSVLPRLVTARPSLRLPGPCTRGMTAPGIVKKRVREHSHESNDDATTQPLVELPFSSRGHPGVAPLAEKSEVDLPDPVVDEEVTFVLAGAHIGQLAVLVESVVESCVMAEMITDAKNIIDCAAPVREQTGVPPQWHQRYGRSNDQLSIRNAPYQPRAAQIPDDSGHPGPQ